MLELCLQINFQFSLLGSFQGFICGIGRLRLTFILKMFRMKFYYRLSHTSKTTCFGRLLLIAFQLVIVLTVYIYLRLWLLMAVTSVFRQCVCNKLYLSNVVA